MEAGANVNNFQCILWASHDILSIFQFWTISEKFFDKSTALSTVSVSIKTRTMAIYKIKFECFNRFFI